MKAIRKIADSRIILSSIAIFSCITQNTNAADEATKKLDNMYTVIMKNDQVSEYIKGIKGKNEEGLYTEAIAVYDAPQTKRTLDNMEKFIKQLIKDRSKFDDDNGDLDHTINYTPIEKHIETEFKTEKYSKLEDLANALKSKTFDVLRLKPIKLGRTAYMDLNKSIYIPADINEYAAFKNETTNELKPDPDELAKLTINDLTEDDFNNKEGLIGIDLPTNTINNIKAKYKTEKCSKSNIKRILNEYLSAIVLGSAEHKAIVGMNDKTKYDESEYVNMVKLSSDITPDELVPEDIKEKYKEQEITEDDLDQYPTVTELMKAASKDHNKKIPYKATKSLSTIYKDADIEEVVLTLKKEKDDLDTQLTQAKAEETKAKNTITEEKSKYAELEKKFQIRINDAKKSKDQIYATLNRKYGDKDSMARVTKDLLSDYATMKEQWKEAKKGGMLKDSGANAALQKELDELRKEKARLEKENANLRSAGTGEITQEDKEFIRYVYNNALADAKKEMNKRWSWLKNTKPAIIGKPDKK